MANATSRVALLFQNFFAVRGFKSKGVELPWPYSMYLGLASLFGDMPEIFSASFSLKPSQPASKQEMLAWEKELLGLYISGHPLDRLREKIEANGMNITKLKAECEKGAAVTFAGIIEEVKPIITKNNERMAFVRVADFTSTIECVIFPKVFSKFGDSIMVDKIIAIKGSVSDRNDEKSVLIDAVKVL
jgi:DNA polymerase-3 subunit alpha